MNTYRTPNPTTVIEALSHILVGASKTTMKQYLKHGRVKLNGVVVKIPDTAIPSGAVVEIGTQSKLLTKKKAPFQIVWEDPHIIVVIKPAGRLSSGEGIMRAPTMHKLVETYVKEQGSGQRGAYVVHRLDKEVTGLLIFGKTEAIQEKLKKEWKHYKKRYIALTEAKPPKQEGTIDTWLAEWKQTMRVVPETTSGALHAVSHYKYLRPEGENHLLEVELETGKKNQIRIHLAHIGSHIVGDRKYGASDKVHTQVRLMAYQLEITHPITAKPHKWEIQPDTRFLNPEMEVRSKRPDTRNKK